MGDDFDLEPTDEVTIDTFHCRTCARKLDPEKVSWFQPNKSVESLPYCDDLCVKWRFIPVEAFEHYWWRVLKRQFKGIY